ncbi:hypothetical protein NMD1_00865 [Novosphingobium sp. MD-1]|nr:hypothetical protein NMD1_00865 [Novosphingobium sp. MD-1]
MAMGHRVQRFLSFPVPRKYLVWALALSFLVSALDIFAPLETFHFAATIPFRERTLDNYVLVEESHGFDNRSLGDQRLLLAKALTELDNAGAKRIIINEYLDQPSTPEADTRLGQAIARLSRPVIAVLEVFPANDGPMTERSAGWLPALSLHAETFPVVREDPPLPQLRKNILYGNALTYSLFRSPKGSMSPWLQTRQGVIPPVAALATGATRHFDTVTPVNPTIDGDAVERLSLLDVASARFPREKVAGRLIIISQTDSAGVGAGGPIFSFGINRTAPAQLIVQMETYRHGVPIQIGWLPIWLAALALPHFMWGLGRRAFRFRHAAYFSIGAFFTFGALARWAVDLEIVPGILLAWVYAGLMRWKLDIQQAGDAFRLVDGDTGLANRAAFAEAAIAAGTMGVCCMRVTCLADDDAVRALQSAAERIRDHGLADVVFQTAPETLAFHVDLTNIHRLRDTLYTVASETGVPGGLPVDTMVSAHTGIAFLSGGDMATALTRAGEAAQSAQARRIPFAIARSAPTQEANGGNNVTALRPYRPVLNLMTGQICGAEFTQTITRENSAQVMVQLRTVLSPQEYGHHDMRLWLNIEADLLDDPHLWEDLGHVLAGKPDVAQRLTIGVDRLESVERGGLRDSQLIRLRKLGVECSLLGLGLARNMDFATLRRLRATQMKLSETFSGFSYIAGERLLRASVDLGRDLGRSILVPNLTSAADLAAAKVAGIDYGLGKAVGEVMALEELLATIARQRRVS